MKDLLNTPGPTIMLYSRRDTGGTTLIHDILLQTYNITNGLYFYRQGHETIQFNNVLPKKLMHDKYNTVLVKQLCDTQRGLKHDRRSAFMVLDDEGPLYPKNIWKTDENLRYLFINSRRLNILTIFTLQYPSLASLNIGTAFDYIFIFRNPIVNDRIRFYEHYGKMFSSYEQFVCILTQCTKERGDCLVIKQGVTSNNINECVFWYRADEHPERAIELEHNCK